MCTLYENIIRLCEEHGIKGGKMCTDIGISKSTLTDLKAGRKKTLTVQTASKIANYFGVPVDVLTGEGDKSILSENLVYYSQMSAIGRETISRVMDVPLETVNAWFSGEEYPTLREIDTLAGYFNVMRDDLIKKRPTETEETPHTLEMDDKTYTAVRMFRNLSPAGQDYIIGQMARMLFS